MDKLGFDFSTGVAKAYYFHFTVLAISVLSYVLKSDE